MSFQALIKLSWLMYLKLFSQVSKYFHSCLSCRSYIALEQRWISENLGSGVWEWAVQPIKHWILNRTAGHWVNLLDESVSGKSCVVMGELSSLSCDACPANAFCPIFSLLGVWSVILDDCFRIQFKTTACPLSLSQSNGVQNAYHFSDPFSTLPDCHTHSPCNWRT